MKHKDVSFEELLAKERLADKMCDIRTELTRITKTLEEMRSGKHGNPHLLNRYYSLTVGDVDDKDNTLSLTAIFEEAEAVVLRHIEQLNKQHEELKEQFLKL